MITKHIPYLLFGPLMIATTHADVVTDWNNAAIAAIRADAGYANPGDSTRGFAMLNTAIFDAINSVNQTHSAYLSRVEGPSNASAEAAAAQAAYTVMTSMFPQQSSNFQSLLQQHLGQVTDSAARNNGVSIGGSVAYATIVNRANDGAQTSSGYQITDAIGHWTPDPTHPAQKAWGPDWGNSKTWSVPDGTTYAAGPPPALNSLEYLASYNEVKAYGSLDSAVRSADQTEIGIFWAYDRPQMGPPPVLFNQVLQAVANDRGNTLEENARLFALASIAMADASITSWNTKYEYDLWRPITAIRNGDSDGNFLTEGDPNWTPLGAPGNDPNSTADDFTPAFPAYTSGHATMGAAMATTLALFYGSDVADIDLTSDELEGVVRHFDTFSQMSEENAQSRIYLGVHWSFDATEGIVMGDQIARAVYANELRQVPEPQVGCLLVLSGLLLARRKR